MLSLTVSAFGTDMRRRDFFHTVGGAVAWPVAAPAAWSANSRSPAKIGWLKIQGPRHTPDQLKSFREGMSALGHIEGRDYVLIERFAEGMEARLPGLASELIDLGVRLILATSQPSIAAAGRVTKTVPIIGRINDDPVDNGMAKWLAGQGGIISGVYGLAEELTRSGCWLLKEVVPSASARRSVVARRLAECEAVLTGREVLRNDWGSSS